MCQLLSSQRCASHVWLLRGLFHRGTLRAWTEMALWATRAGLLDCGLGWTEV